MEKGLKLTKQLKIGKPKTKLEKKKIEKLKDYFNATRDEIEKK
jgi:hypothetical protein